MTSRDLTKELYFTEKQGTSELEIEKLSIHLLKQDWTIDTYRFLPSKVFNLYERGWRFEFHDRKNAAGTCHLGNKVIKISRWLLRQNLNKGLEFENTIRHEIAHAIEFEIRGESDHGKLWKFIARQVLCTAERCFSREQIGITETTKYTLVCDSCGKNTASHRAKKRDSACGNCCREHNFGRFSAKFILRQVQNY
jgi:predicted SprT family Zn-dependent metalloprotease